MPMTWRYDAEANIVYSEGSGVLRAEEVVEYLQAVVADERIQPGFIELTSFANCRLDYSYDETPPFPQMWQRYREKGSRGTIVLAPDDVTFGLVRMVQTVLDQPESGARFIAVRTQEEADAALEELQRG